MENTKNRYTAFVRWDSGRCKGYIEEIDVDAETHDQAKKLAQAELDALFEPGGTIFRVMERFGLYM